MAKFTIDGYGQIELNNASFLRDGGVEAQSKISPVDFEDPGYAENGMVLQLNGPERMLEKPVADSGFPLVVLYTSESAGLYENHLTGLKNHKNDITGFYPRAGHPRMGDKWTTNCFGYGDGIADDEAAVTAIKAAKDTPLYAVPGAEGYIELTTTAPTEGLAFRVIKPHTMPDGQFAIQVQVISI